MKKTLLSISLIASTLLFGADNSTTTKFLDTAVEDVYDVHNSLKSKMDTLLNGDADLKEYSQEITAIESKISSFLENQANEFSSKEDAQKALDDLVQLSTQTTVLAKTMAYLASHQADNSNESYNNTIENTSKTILRLSDDIGVMADRIGEMADRIGVMADRIVKTQEIQSKNYNATLQLTKYAMNSISAQNSSTNGIQSMNNMNTNMSNMNSNMSNMNQNIQNQPLPVGNMR